MIKALALYVDGNSRVILGLSYENVRRLKEDDPILFNLSELGLPPRLICLCCSHNGGFYLPEYQKDEPPTVIALSEQALEKLKTELVLVEVESNTTTGMPDFVLFSGETEASMVELLQEFIGPNAVVQDTTRYKRTGEVPPFSAN